MSGSDRDGISSRASRTEGRLRVAAREAFAELGWQATRVQDIVERAGVSHGTFYTYYDNKTAVLADLARRSQADLAVLAEASWEGPDVRGALREILGGLISLYERDLPVLRTWLDAGRDEPELRSLYLELRAQFRDRVRENVETVLDLSGRHEGPPAATIASALVAMVEHFLYTWLTLGEDHDPEDVLDALLTIWGSTLNALAGFELVCE